MHQIDAYDSEGEMNGGNVTVGKAHDGDTLLELVTVTSAHEGNGPVLINREMAIELMAQLGVFIATT